MRFHLIDRIVGWQPDRIIRAYRNLTLGEEYLADHFPTFPVMPGVLMLQALVEAASWLVRVSEDFKHSVIVLREVKNVKYGTFMEPGRRMQITAEIVEKDDLYVICKGKGEIDGQSTVSARFTLARYNLQENNPALSATDDHLKAKAREWLALLRGDLVGSATVIMSPGEGMGSRSS